jgi:hypothetical protein
MWEQQWQRQALWSWAQLSADWGGAGATMRITIWINYIEVCLIFFKFCCVCFSVTTLISVFFRVIGLLWTFDYRRNVMWLKSEIAKRIDTKKGVEPVRQPLRKTRSNATVFLEGCWCMRKTSSNAAVFSWRGKTPQIECVTNQMLWLKKSLCG